MNYALEIERNIKAVCETYELEVVKSTKTYIMLEGKEVDKTKFYVSEFKDINIKNTVNFIIGMISEDMPLIK